MNVIVEFKEMGNPVQVFISLQGSAALDSWHCPHDERSVFDAIDQVPWGPREASEPQAVLAAGQLLRAKFAAAPALTKALIDTFATNGQAVRPLYFQLGAEPAVETVPFEAIWDDHVSAFIGLDARWPIARIPADAVKPAGPFTMERTVRIAAVLAAEGADPRKQLTGLRQACDAAPGLRVEVTVLTNCSGIIAEMTTAAKPGWTAEPVPGTTDGLMVRLKEIQPHLLHVFCHGTADGPRLMVSQLNDLGVLEVGVTAFEGLSNGPSPAPWLVMLNCCEGATPGHQAVSLASGLARAGMPAVIGMRRMIDKTVADQFCADLYRVALAELARISPRGRQVSTLDWAAVLHEPRRRLSAMHGTPADVAGRQKEWTMPVLYLSTPRLELRGAPTTDISDARAKEEIITLSVFESLLASRNIPQESADSLRALALSHLYR
ncbi:CHAT domain-containing protein [Lentzea sp. NPDC006480]|uniref:CHAT domain-containing protein n=1 Tax=Lentzea sp. NPDC006480 TaxID=3157176 RepID=UPI0033A14563